jgi:hypothetical protein
MKQSQILVGHTYGARNGATMRETRRKVLRIYKHALSPVLAFDEIRVEFHEARQSRNGVMERTGDALLQSFASWAKYEVTEDR